jgi:predicted RNA polymerase sigma factor
LTARAVIEAVWRIEQPKLAARLTRALRDIGLAEEVVQDAFVLALEHWPRDGIPRNPAAWLTRVATNRALDRLRRTVMIDGKHRVLAIDLAELEREMPGVEAALDEDIDDDLLRLIFTACHPLLPAEQRAALALRMLPSASCAPSGPCARPASSSRRRAQGSVASASAPCWK